MSASSMLIFSEAVWRETRLLLEPYATAEVEAGLFWYGIRSDEVAVAVSAGIPHQINRASNFEISSDDLARLVRRVPEPMVVVAQLHTHPGPDTHHSSWDDERAVSRKAFSLVFPDYGHDANVSTIRVHEFRDRWDSLNPLEASKRLIMVPSVLDTRV